MVVFSCIFFLFFTFVLLLKSSSVCFCIFNIITIDDFTFDCHSFIIATTNHNHKTDDFFIPALNVLCHKCNISQDFAGATLMPAGSEIPDILISTFGMLILHSDVGVGTIAGSMLFNILVIVGGCVIAVDTLKLETGIVLRDLLFFSASLLLLLASSVNGEITVWEAVAFIVLYGLYITTCYNTENIKVAWRLLRQRFSGGGGAHGDREMDSVDKDGTDDLKEGLLDHIKKEGEEEHQQHVEIAVDERGEEGEITGPVRGQSEQTARRLQTLAFKEQQLSRALDSGRAQGYGYGAARMHGTLYKRCEFYDRLQVSSRAWQQRWFVLDENLWYCRNPLHADEKRRVVPLWAATRVERDAQRDGVFAVVTPQQTYTFRAETPALADAWVAALRERLLYLRAAVDAESGRVFVPPLPAGATVDGGAEGSGSDYVEEDDDEDASLLTKPPGDASTGKKAMWWLTLPYAAAFTWTIPNVRRARWRRWYPLTLLLVCAWLGVLVYAMVWCADRLAVVLGIPGDLMGLAFTGICASLPCLFGSLVCARQGAGGMAIANAIASNTTCILLGFGLPFFLQTAVVAPGSVMPIDGESIPLSVIVLLSAVAIFLAGAVVCCMRLKRPAGFIYIAAFVLLLATILLLNSLGVKFTF